MLVLQDARALLRFIPTRFLRKELEMDPPLQALEARNIPLDEKLARFRKALFLLACTTSNRADELSASFGIMLYLERMW